MLADEEEDSRRILIASGTDALAVSPPSVRGSGLFGGDVGDMIIWGRGGIFCESYGLV